MVPSSRGGDPRHVAVLAHALAAGYLPASNEAERV